MKIDKTLVSVAASVVAIVGIGVVGGAALLNSGSHSPRPSEAPAAHQVADVTPSPAPVTVTVTRAASPVAVVHHVVRPSKRAAKVPAKVHRAPRVTAPMQTQETPVSEPSDPPVDPSPPTVDPTPPVIVTPDPVDPAPRDPSDWPNGPGRGAGTGPAPTPSP